MRSDSGQPCSRCRSGDLRVHALARRMHIRLRGAVLRNSPRPASVRSASGPDSDRAWHLGYWEAILAPRRSLREKPSPLPASSRRYAAQYFVGRIQPPRLASCSAAHPPNRGSVFSLRSRLVPRPASRTGNGGVLVAQLRGAAPAAP